MLVLALDTATPAVTVALAEVGADAVAAGAVNVLAVRVGVDARRHGELLGPAVRDVLAEATIEPRDLAAVAVGLGPGPFTGLRVGLVTAAALADALGIPAYGACSLDAIAGRPGVPLLVATDARRHEVYWAAYDADGVRPAGPAVDRPAELAAMLAEPRLAGLGLAAMAGAGAERYAEVLGLPLRGPAYPDPGALVRLVADRVRAGAPADPLTPLYLRRPDAEMPGRAKPVLQA
ncbi:MAG TPA: tRNA (adenosine(37)-N6)-threonylcarbamoyltransferase complex dimerization subunit type 1 TsaB [Mycobacteriales bacterium]|nr:tRNA (adenosine(37)-N6)-threonylcarbamoyltransferase complex dimerization subunit type 1 TsaB [Mycobacteriales bacterium]